MSDDQGGTRHPVVNGQRVRGVKVERARQLRREMTTAERILWHLLRDNQLDGLHFRRQQVIAGFIVDFYCHAARVVVELDGAVHQRTAAYDTTRDELLTAQGLLVLRFTNNQLITSRNDVLRQIAATCAQHMTDSPPRQDSSTRPRKKPPTHAPPPPRVPPPLRGEGVRG